jgi:outer membrane protein OmpA-like peptidoglycan-associated protein
MARWLGQTTIIVALVALLASVGLADEDREGCSDYPLLSRLDGFSIEGCKTEPFTSHKFTTEEGKVTVEGRLNSVSYRRPDTAPEMSGVEMIRNYANAIGKIGGEVLYQGRYSGSMRVVVDDRQIWIEVLPYGNRAYRLDIVEKQAMTQQVVADAAALLADLDRSGHAVLHGVFFETDTATVRPESAAALAEIAALLRDHPQLAAFVVGHTDMTGAFEHNLDLSERRAGAVVDALVEEHGISRDRLTARGVGPLAPIGSNRTETGRALNRRVELVAR